MDKIVIEKKAKELKEIISSLEHKIEKEESGIDVKSDKIQDRITYLKRKLYIFKELLLKYTSPSIE